MRRELEAAGGSWRVLALVALQGLTGLVAISALVYVLLLGPRVQHVEHRIVEVQRIVRTIEQRVLVRAPARPSHAGGVMPGKPPERGSTGPAPRDGVGPRQEVMPAEIPKVRSGPAPSSARARLSQSAETFVELGGLRSWKE